MAETMLSKYIVNFNISIDESNWESLNDRFTKEELADAFVNEIISGNIKLPLSEITVLDAVEDFCALKDADTSRYLVNSKMLTKYQYKYPIDGVCIDCPPLGNKASNYFQEEARFKCESVTAPSPYRVWHNESFIRTTIPALWSLRLKKVDMNTLRTCLFLRKYVAAQFKPLVAKTVFDMLGSKKILDFCAGWGDRLCGFYASKAEEYFGVDPSDETFPNYLRQIELYDRLSKFKKVKMIHGCAESTEYPDNYFDTVFTSPPYFDLERYDSNGNQSYKKHKKFDDWMNNFLFASIKKAWNSLSLGGYLVINISDVYSHHRVFNICDPMNEFIASLGGKFIKVIGMKLSKRPNAKYMIDKDGVFIEPIWVWRKIENYKGQLALNFEY